MKILKNSSGNIVLSTDTDEIIAVIPPGQHVYPSRIKNDEVHISKGSGNFSEINRITINSSEVTEAFGSPFSGNRDALIKLLSENFSSGSGGGGLDPKAYDLADFKNQSSDAFVRKSDESFWRVGGNPNTSYSQDGRILNYVGGLMQTILGVVDYNKLTERLADNPRLKAIDDALNDIQAKQQQLYDDFDSGKITAEEFNQKQQEFSQEAQDLYQQRTVVFNEEAAKLKDVEGLQVLTLNNDSATFFKPVYTTNSIQSPYYNDKISIWDSRLNFYENGSYRYGYDGTEFIQHLKDLNTVVRISSYQTMYNAAYSKDVIARYPNGTIAFLSSATNSNLSKFISSPYNSGIAYFVTDKPVVFTNLQNADGDNTFNKQLVAKGYGVIGIKSVDADTGTTKKSIVTQPVDAGLEGNATNPYQVRIMTRVESDIRFISGTSGNGSISASNASYSTDKYVNIHENSVYMPVFTHEGINPNTGLQRYRVDIMIPVSKALVLSNKDTANDTIIKIQCENSVYKYELNGKIPAAIINRIITENLT